MEDQEEQREPDLPVSDSPVLLITTVCTLNVLLSVLSIGFAVLVLLVILARLR